MKLILGSMSHYQWYW